MTLAEARPGSWQPRQGGRSRGRRGRRLGASPVLVLAVGIEAEVGRRDSYGDYPAAGGIALGFVALATIVALLNLSAHLRPLLVRRLPARARSGHLSAALAGTLRRPHLPAHRRGGQLPHPLEPGRRRGPHRFLTAGRARLRWCGDHSDARPADRGAAGARFRPVAGRVPGHRPCPAPTRRRRSRPGTGRRRAPEAPPAGRASEWSPHHRRRARPGARNGPLAAVFGHESPRLTGRPVVGRRSGVVAGHVATQAWAQHRQDGRPEVRAAHVSPVVAGRRGDKALRLPDPPDRLLYRETVNCSRTAGATSRPYSSMLLIIISWGRWPALYLRSKRATSPTR